MVWDKAYGIIIGVTMAILIIGFLKWKCRLLFSFLLRGVVGVLFILAGNKFLTMQNMESIIAVNPLTFLITGGLGLPGVILLCIINFIVIYVA